MLVGAPAAICHAVVPACAFSLMIAGDVDAAGATSAARASGCAAMRASIATAK